MASTAAAGNNDGANRKLARVAGIVMAAASVTLNDDIISIMTPPPSMP